ncbi:MULTISPECIES: TetR/AcrR family transcriptional regulator [unclassified Novosphingobium]|uniref:TetR/AcrR family transcriptional regulator n=1 Tax=unclassified Novosphingobium TaxID=2644732 RepID=UPI000A835BF9|nr:MULTISPECIES: TetR/AcrR family transcriptional regulator [unclassified Novosphingobium]MDR6709091.1 AcrR family transcriptional regulator [Novosphingobium sp. 1748]NKJ02582.1 AcrR family transcriptional regulator [Novosphingobium sp. SG707]
MNATNEGNERPQTYASPAIIERRRRILEETRQVIAEQGITALNMNDIGRRAGVAKRTLYNAFQTRERMIAAAIQEYFEEYVSRITFTQPSGTLQHNLERMISVVQRNRRIPNYIRAIMALYFSPEVDEDIWLAMHSIATRQNRAWIENLAAGKQLQAWVEVDTLVDDLVRLEYAMINDWARGRIPDDAIIVRLITSYLTLILGAVRGAARKEVEAMLKDIAERGSEALPMRKRAKAEAAE